MFGIINFAGSVEYWIQSLVYVKYMFYYGIIFLVFGIVNILDVYQICFVENSVVVVVLIEVFRLFVIFEFVKKEGLLYF